MSGATSWRCAECGRSWAPHVDYCRQCDGANATAAPTSDPTFAELWQSYERERGPELSSWHAVHRVHGLHLLPFFGPLPASMCSREKADEYVRLRRTQSVRRITREERKRRVSITTIDHELATLKACLRWHLVERRSISAHPLEGYKIKVLKEDLPTIQDRKFYLPEDGFLKILTYVNPTVRRMLVFAFETGMRRDEFRRLRWDEVDMEKAIVRLAPERTKAGVARDVPLSSVAINALRRQAPASEGCRYVFVNPFTTDDQPVPKSTLYQQFRSAREAAGVKGPRNQEIWTHTLRKSFATLTAMRTSMPVRLQMEILGHASEEVHREYIELADEHLQEARRYLDEKRRGPLTAPDPLKLVKGE